MPKNIAIKVQNLTKVYKLYKQPIDRIKESLHPFKKKYHKDFSALNNVSFEIKKGESVGIIGRNGSGKSTLLKVITGVLTPTSGRAIVHGKISAILELGSGFNPEMSGIENIYLNTLINGLNRKQTDKKISEIEDFAELGDFIHHPMKIYSSGMKARLAFAVAINIDPDILIVDEALSVGDAAFKRKCFAKMEQIRKNGATILFVSHSEGSIVSLCNRAIWISNGHQIIDGTPKLVTGLYLKHINAKQINKDKIQKEYAGLNSKNNSESTKDKGRHREKTEQNEQSIEEFFSPALMPKSTISYEEKGAKISDVKVTTLNGKKVNFITQENHYKINIQFELFEIFHDIRLGVAIKDMKGIHYSGAAYELLKHNQTKELKKGKYSIEWDFYCLLVEGVFIIDAVVFNNYNLNRQVAHKVTDGYLFKVLRYEKENIIQSHVPMISGTILNEIN